MRKSLLLLAIIATTLLSSCEKEVEISYELEGTIWKSVSNDSVMGLTVTTIIEFQKETLTMKTTHVTNGEEPNTLNGDGMYTYYPPTVHMTFATVTMGTINGNTMVSEGDTFTKQ